MTILDPFSYEAGTAPLLVSIPHAGTRLTPAVEAGLSEAARPLPDTDWHIPRLYDFARSLGAHILVGRYSRMVIDLNRPPDDKPLYATATTGLYPDTLFDGTPVFMAGKTPSDAERKIYLDEIWHPYHRKIQDCLSAIKARHDYALLFDAHSIASKIPRLFDGTLPDLNLGTNDGKSCPPSLNESLAAFCRDQPYSHVLNGRFKGGYITRAYGQPHARQYAVQLELAQCNYMQESVPFDYLPERAEPLQNTLRGLVALMLDWGKQQA
ncbi:N-formylglutamate deformylase [Martelella alba]|uniref:N-formylglutamate deformylase n=1 Tax=Martelella alba TaxID=2590451 RepID=A0ABY2SEV8_9HYPH|nr:N-formylglutamate deformylase [Martelella alba]TKI03386.1 N-formylglutamate deformylase [Martelella alba]